MSLSKPLVRQLLWFLPLAGMAVWSASAPSAGDAAVAVDEPQESSISVALPRAVVAAAEVVAGGRSLPFRVLEARPWQVAIYFDQLLSDPRVLRNAAVLLAERAGALADLGPVQVLLGGETVRSALPPTQDSSTISETLGWLRIRETSADAQASVRSEFVAALTAGEVSDAELALLLEDALAREAELIRVQREGLLLWATEHRTAGPRLLLLVGSGYDADPAVFYTDLLSDAGRAGVGVGAASVRPTASEVGQALAVTGWTVIAYAPGERGDALLSGPTAVTPPAAVPTPDGREIERGVLSFDPRRLLRRGKSDEAEAGSDEVALLVNPLSSLEPLTQATAGAVIHDGVVLDNWLEELGWRALLAVQVPVAAEPLPLEVRAAEANRPVAAALWLGRGAPAALSAARARFLASSGESAAGDLQIAALVAAGNPPQLAIELSSAGGERPLRPPLRLTIAEVAGASATILEQRELGLAEIGRGRFDVPLTGGQSGERAIIVVVDELSSSRWGGAFAGYTTRADDLGAGGGSALLDLPAAATVRLLAPQAALLVGRVRFAAVVSDPAIVRVDFLLDGEREAVRRAPPYEVQLDLGPLPRTRRVEVVARDGAGEEIGRDVLLVNSGNSELSVRLVAPGAEISPGGSVTAQGALTVEAEVAAPRGVRVARVEF
ncbi:MAG: hypothetical protein O7A04_12470, partial [Acidobacteria bacterium]|nr:hypothetical protein [Acidobacteriota bacterium]